MTTTPVERILDFQIAQLEAVRQPSITHGVVCRTVEGSRIAVYPLPWGIRLSGLSGYTSDQKCTWQLHASLFAAHRNMLYLSVPSVSTRERIDIPLARLEDASAQRLIELQDFVEQANAMLEETRRP
jgi:hypothetical protein